MGGGPPQSRGNPPPDFSLPSEPHPNGSRRAWTSARDQVFAFSLTFTCLFVSHATLLRLPYFWDEAGYFVPAARDLMLTGSLIPHSTLSNAHPPLVMLWLAFWWKYSAFTPATDVRRTTVPVESMGSIGDRSTLEISAVDPRRGGDARPVANMDMTGFSAAYAELRKACGESSWAKDKL